MSKTLSKKLSKALLVVALLAIVLVSVFAFVGCADKGDNSQKTVSVYIGDENAISYSTNCANVFDMLVEMKQKGVISVFEYSESAYGAFITKIGEINPVGSSQWVSVYHDIDDVTLRDMSEWASPNIIKDGKTFFSSGVGVSSLIVKNGASYLFALGAY